VTGSSGTEGVGATPSGTPGGLPPAEGAGDGRGSLVAALLTLAAIACIVLLALVLPAARSDPYTRATLELHGAEGNGGRLFRLNCAGCHGLAAQGLVGPNLHGVDRRKNDRQLIQQVVSGRTPPMPSFQPDPQDMADLLAFLHSLP
jgi:mono/diheme cytochrome c family protein